MVQIRVAVREQRFLQTGGLGRLLEWGGRPPQIQAVVAAVAESLAGQRLGRRANTVGVRLLVAPTQTRWWLLLRCIGLAGVAPVCLRDASV